MEQTTVEIGNTVAQVPDEIMDNVTWAVNQLRNVERRPVTVKSVCNILSVENISFSSEDTVFNALVQIGYRPQEVL